VPDRLGVIASNRYARTPDIFTASFLPMTLTHQQLNQLSSDLPPLQFDVAQDLLWAENPLAQAYLTTYGLNLTQKYDGVRHAFGCVDVAGFRVATHYWLPENPRGSLVIVHGYYDHVGVFGNAIRFALQNNFAVLTFDLPGHGLSSGDQAAIDSFDQYGDVMHQILNRAASVLPQPLHALGQSTGAAVILNYLWRHEHSGTTPIPLDKIALFAPLIVPRGWGSGRFLFYALRRFVRRMRRGSSRSSHDPEFTHFVENEDILQPKFLSLKWVGAMAQWHEFFLRAEVLRRPILVVQGTGDMTVAWRYNLKKIRKKLPEAEIRMIKGAGHQLINESPIYRDQLLDIVREWFLK
jgi:alpha-beta hydrolase superfamily lysophospholipase